MSGYFSTPIATKIVLPCVIIGGCIMVCNAVSSWRQVRGEVKDKCEQQIVARHHDSALVEVEVDEDDDEDALTYITLLGFRVDVDLTMDDLPDYWGHAFYGIYESCIEHKHTLLTAWWKSGCEKFGVQVRNEEHLLWLADQCDLRNINYVILKENDITGVDIAEPRLNVIVMGPCKTKELEKFTKGLPPFELH